MFPTVRAAKIRLPLGSAEAWSVLVSPLASEALTRLAFFAYVRRMHTVRGLLSTVAVTLAVCALGGCGGSGSPGVAQVGHAKIVQATVEHWARAFAGQAIIIDDGIPAPRALLTNLADERQCAADAAPLAARARLSVVAVNRKPAPTVAQLRSGCRELYASARRQATEYLISVQEALVEAEKYGIKVSAQDAQRYLTHWEQATLAAPGELGKYLADRGWTLTDELFDAKRAVLWQRLTQHIRKVADTSGGGETAYADLLRANAREVTKLTRCSAAYMVSSCNGYRAPAHPELSLAVAAERLISGG